MTQGVVVKRVLRLKLAPLFLLLLFATVALGSNYHHKYSPLHGTELTHKSSWTVDYGDGLTVEYALFAEKGVLYDTDVIKEHLVKGAKYTFASLRARGIQTKDCRPKETVEVFAVKEVTLNDENRFPAFKDKKIVGLYDPVFAIDNYSTITLAEQLPRRYKGTVVHEAAHYWYDRFCLERANVGDTEEFAEEIEDIYYRSNK